MGDDYRVNEQAVKSYVEDYIATNRVDATTADLARLYAISVTVGACADLRADTLAQVPMRVIAPTGEVADDRHPLAALFKRSFNLADLMRRTELSQCFWGHTLLYKHRNTFQVPQRLEWVNPLLYTPDTVGGVLRGFNVYHGRYKLDAPRHIARRDAIYLHGVDFDDDYDGVAPAERAFLESAIEPERAQTALSLFRNLAIPAAIAQPTADTNARPSKDDRDSFAATLRRVALGALNAGRTIITSARWEWIQLQQPFKDLALSEQAQESRLAVCIAFRVPLELLVPSAANYAQFEGARRTWAHAWLVPQAEWYAAAFTEQLAAEFGAGWRIEPAFEDVPFLKEDTAARVEVVSAKVNGGLLTLAEAQRELGQPPDPHLKDLYLVPGVGPVPAAEVKNLWRYRVTGAPSTFNAGTLSGDPLPDTPQVTEQTVAASDAAPTAPPAADKDADVPDTSLCILLDCAAHPDLIALQARAKAAYPDHDITWNAPDTFHITLAYAPVSTEAQTEAVCAALAGLDVPPLVLSVGSLKAFDTLGDYALHFRLRRNTDLLDLQETIYDLCADAGLTLSGHSAPDAYTPHITLGYAKSKPRPIYFTGAVTVAPTHLCLSRGDAHTELYRAPVVAPPAAVPDAAWKELQNWERLAGRKGRAYPFTPRALDGVTAAFVTLSLEDDDCASAAIFGDARDLAAKRYYGIGGTRETFQLDLTRLIDRAASGDAGRRAFAASLRALLRRYGLQAFQDGYDEVGVAHESFSTADLAAFRAWQAEQSAHVTRFGAELFTGDGLPEGAVARRAELWANKSLDELFYRAMRLAAPAKRYTWRRDDAKDSCDDCRGRDGKSFTLEELATIGFPRAQSLQCGGWECGCNLYDERGKKAARCGGWPPLSLEGAPPVEAAPA